MDWKTDTPESEGAVAEGEANTVSPTQTLLTQPDKAAERKNPTNFYALTGEIFFPALGKKNASLFHPGFWPVKQLRYIAM